MSMELRTIENKLPDLAGLVRAALAKQIDAAGAAMEAAAKDAAPVDKGELRDSIHFERTGPLSGELVAGTDHAAPNEFGTHNRPAHPFMRPQAEQIAADLSALVARAVNEAAQ